MTSTATRPGSTLAEHERRTAGDRSSDVLHYTRHPLDSVFAPSSVAVIGATEKVGSVGRTVLWNLISSPFGGTVYPINPKRPSILGIKAYPDLAAVPDPVELAVIVTPAVTAPDLVHECAEKGVRAVVVISAGFKETGAAGAELERRILDEAQRAGMRIVGPNCLGVMNPHSGLNATFAAGIARPGSVGFISQSGALLTAVLDWAEGANVGFSTIASLGSMLDVGWGDMIYYLGDDPRTQSIVLYMETVGDARAFLSAAREVALTKPIIVIKPGRSEQAAKAAASHTGSLTGSDDVLAAAFRRAGVLRVDAIADLFEMSEVLATQPRPKGRNLTIVSNAGGPGVLATDELIAGGGALTALTETTMDGLNAILPAAWSHNNPVDVLGDAAPDLYAKAVRLAADDPGTDGVLVILTPQAMTDATRTAEELVPLAHLPGNKPLLASWMGGPLVEEGISVLARAGIPSFPYPDAAVRMFNYMWQSNENLRFLYETPLLPADVESAMHRDVAREVIEGARREGRTLLTEVESKRVLSAYAIPITETRIAPTEDEAVAAAEAIGFPVVVKLYSHTISHKTDVGGVQLNLPDAQAVRAAYRSIREAVVERRGAEHFEGVTVQQMINYTGYELIIGSSIDPQFGPVLLFGAGGALVELFRDRSLGLPPLNTTLARRLIERTKIYGALKGVRGRRAVDLEALEQLLVRFSQLVVEQPSITEIDINPLLASPERLIAVDARIVLAEPSVPEAELPRVAIRPYPRQYVGEWQARSGESFTIRPIRPEDEPLMVRFHATLSAETVYARYFSYLGLSQRTAHERLTRICFIDYDRQMALVAERRDPVTGEPEIVAVGRLTKAHGRNDAEFAILVADRWQRIGLGTELLQRLVQIGRDEGLNRIWAEMLAANPGMQHASRTVGFTLGPGSDRTTVHAELRL